MARVLHTSLVAPSPAGTALQESSLPLTSLDAIWLHAPPVERVFFYANATGNDVLSNLKDSLSRTLRDFYPLAGRLRLTPGTPNRHELHYKPGDGVNFTVAEYHHAGFDELATDDPTEVAKILPLVPALQAGGALLALQATMLSGGLTLGVTFHHGACDGVSSTHFLRTWAWAAPACAGANAPEPPVIDRTFIRDRDGLYDTFTAPRLSSDDEDDGGKPLGVISPDVHQLFATFTLSKEHLQRIKDAVAREAEHRGVPTPRSTSIVAAFGFISSSCTATSELNKAARARQRRRLVATVPTSSSPLTTGPGWIRPSRKSTSATASAPVSRRRSGRRSPQPAQTAYSPRAPRSRRPST
ncbi:hypothetical protein ACQ4PT_022237 [Festuca glaucescens]